MINSELSQTLQLPWVADLDILQAGFDSSRTDSLRKMTFQLQVSLTLKHTLLYLLFYYKWDHNVQMEHMEEQLKLAIKTINSKENKSISTVISS